MPGFYWLHEDEGSRSSGEVSGTHRWGLPGISCPACGVSWANTTLAYPFVDLSGVPEESEFEEPRRETYEVFVRLREAIRPLLPPGKLLQPGTGLGPLVGTARGRFGPFCFLNPWTLLMRRENLEQLQAEGLQGLLGVRPRLRYRHKKNPPELVELQLEPEGLLHPDCLPPECPPQCSTCGRYVFSLPEEPLLEAASLPASLDLFRLANFTTVLIASARFVETVRRLGFDGVRFQELPTR